MSCVHNPKSPQPIIRLEKRAGKQITIISGLHTYGTGRLLTMAQALKSALGTGGTVKEGTIEIQGDKVVPVQKWFVQNSGK